MKKQKQSIISGNTRQPALLPVYIILIFLSFGPVSNSQVQKSGNIRGYLYSIIDQLPGAGQNDYQPPSAADKATWRYVIKVLLAHDYQTAASLAESLHYTITDFNDDGTHYYVMEREIVSGPFWGTYIYNPEGCRNVVIQCPHPKYDSNTGKEGIYVFSKSRAMFYCLSGTHRCNSSAYTTCSGTTSVCSGSPESFRISDPAHNVNSIFQATTEALHQYDSTLVFIQLHGFAKHTDDPYVIMSNGTRITPNPDYILLLKNELAAIDPVLTFQIAHLNLSWNRLIAFTNVQGRYLGDSPDPCHENADTTYGTFIHIEQEKSRLRADSMQWDKMARAVNNTFTCQPSGFNILHAGKNMHLYPNPVNDRVTLDLEQTCQEVTVRLFTINGRMLMKQCFYNVQTQQIYFPFRPGSYLLEVFTPEDKSEYLIIKK